MFAVILKLKSQNHTVSCHAHYSPHETSVNSDWPIIGHRVQKNLSE